MAAALTKQAASGIPIQFRCLVNVTVPSENVGAHSASFTCCSCGKPLEWVADERAEKLRQPNVRLVWIARA
jgi:hypothetical protein